MLYFSGAYLFNPKGTRGVPNVSALQKAKVMSVSDQYLYRWRITRRAKIRRAAVSLADAWKASVRDAFGSSLRLPQAGYGISLDPGFNLFRGRNTVVVQRSFLRGAEPQGQRDLILANHSHGRRRLFADYAAHISSWPGHLLTARRIHQERNATRDFYLALLRYRA